MSKLTLRDSKTNDNRFIHWCDAHDQRRLYNICVKLTEAYKADRIEPEDIYGDCANAMRRGTCNALKMRNEELDKGEPIYFLAKEDVIDTSIKKIDKSSVSYKTGWNRVGGKKTKDMKPPKPPKIKAKPANSGVEIADGDYATAINTVLAHTVVAREENQPIVTATQQGRVKSLLELAQEMSEQS